MRFLAFVGTEDTATTDLSIKLMPMGPSEYASGILNWLGNRTYRVWGSSPNYLIYFLIFIQGGMRKPCS